MVRFSMGVDEGLLYGSCKFSNEDPKYGADRIESDGIVTRQETQSATMRGELTR